MSEYSQVEKKVLTQLQRGIEPVERPFQGFDLPEEEVVDLLQRAQVDGVLRRFGGVFDARRLGYKSILCALDVPEDELEEKAAVVSSLSGVTHCYERTPFRGEGSFPTLWFTLALLHDEFESGLETLRSDLKADTSAFLQLPAIKRFKIDVVFDLNRQARDESFAGIVPHVTDNESFRVYTEDEKELVRMLDQQIPMVTRPFAAVAEQMGKSEEFILSTLQEWKELGVLRRIGAVLYHRQVGFKANAMCVWPVGEHEITDAGRRVASRSEVTHCYQRPRLEPFPFDLYAMIHTASWEETEALFYDISSTCDLSGGELFVSGREFKKSSMRYFREE
jgi:siroheme decarboxylase